MYTAARVEFIWSCCKLTPPMITQIYDGIDPTSGKIFVKLASAVKVTWALDLNSGVPFVSGIYIDATDSAVATTVVFEPIDED